MAQDPGRSSGGPLVVVVTGAESTGKSTLAARLAERFHAPLSLEFARAYVDHRGGTLAGHDVDPIARGQMALEDRAHAAAIDTEAPLVVKDTDLVSTVVYARHYHEHCPHWVVHAARARRGDLYLHLGHDVPWVADGPHRVSPQARDALHHQFVAALIEFGVTSVEIAGSWAEREAAADAAIRALVGRAHR